MNEQENLLDAETEEPEVPRKVGLPRFFELLGRDLWSFFRASFLCGLGWLPGFALLAFGLECLGLEQSAMRRRVAETASFFGMEAWFHREVSDLSGGQKQLLNLAAAMVLQPRVLLLDEPTSQLDPIAAGEFLAAVERVHRETGTTVLLTEHHLDRVLPLADRLLVLDGGRLVCQGPPKQAAAFLREAGHAMFRAMPVPVRVRAAVR